jgi:hypothetical protein
MQKQTEFQQILQHYSPDICAIATEVRALIFEVCPQTVEVPWVAQKIIGYGTGYKKMSEHFCWIQPNKNHVNLGFNYGTELPDPDRLLEGTGKLFRHVKAHSLDDVKHRGLRQLLEIACRYRVPQP